jgi:hypothetical protein
VLFGQKDHAYAVFTGGGQVDTRLGHLFPVKIIRQLDQNARAVTAQLVRAHRAPVVQVLQNFQTVLDDGVRFGTFHMRHKTHTTSVFLASRLVHTVCSSRCDLFFYGTHVLLQSIPKGEPEFSAPQQKIQIL